MADWEDRTDIVDRIIRALETFDWAEAERICQTGEDSLFARLSRSTVPFPARESLEILKRLRRKRQFNLMALAADAFLRAGATDAEIRRQYAQAMIDQGNFTVAVTVLQGLLDSTATPERERYEALGLMGRIRKQEYVNASDPSNPRQRQNLVKAASYYLEAFTLSPAKNIWQGINYVAVMERAQRDGLTLETPAKPVSDVLTAIESELKRRIDQDGELFYWDRAIDLEVAVARGEHDRIEDALHWYLRDERADAFEFASTLRQLREVWGLRLDQPPGDVLINGLNAVVLKRGGEGVQVNPGDIRGLLQKNFQGEKDLPLKWWRAGLERCGAIARIEAANGRHLGTGFLVKASDFLAGHSGDPILLLTNRHVVSKDGEDPLSIPPDDGVAHFEACGNAGAAFRLKAVVASNQRVDASFVSFETTPSELGTCPIRVPPVEFDPKQRQRLYVIGYPGGRGLSFSLHDSQWLDSDGAKLHYRTPTEGGSSGSPVFDEDYWMLVGLHHAGGAAVPRLNGQSGTYPANEAFSVAAIREAVATTTVT